MFPPGCRRLWTYLSPSGSGAAAMTTGIVEVACLSVSRFTPAATITSTRRRTSSAAWPAHSSGLPSPLGHEIPPIHVAELAHSAQERDGGRAPGLRPHHVGRRCGEAEDSDPIDLARRLGLGVSRPREGAEGGEAADEDAPVHHWIISSARSSSDGGIVSPSA